MLIYNLHWEANKSVLLYKRINQVDKEGTFHYYQLEKKCKLGFVSVLNCSKVNEGQIVSQEIFDKLIVKN